MSFFAILFALLIEQARPLSRSNPIHGGVRAWAFSVRGHFDAGSVQHAWVSWALAVVLPALLALGVYWLLVWRAVVVWMLLLALLTLARLLG